MLKSFFGNIYHRDEQINNDAGDVTAKKKMRLMENYENLSFIESAHSIQKHKRSMMQESAINNSIGDQSWKQSDNRKNVTEEIR